MTGHVTVDGLTVGRVVRPASIEELAEAARAEKGALVPVGGGTELAFGNPLRAADCAFDLGGLNRIAAYNPADLTIHVEAGVTLGRLREALDANNQSLPLDPWNGPEATMGGLAATNAQGPFRAMGTLRDWIIGMRVVHADGRMSKTGGRVVKNVTGYDLAKLYTGSLGTLAIIAEISLKVRARFGKSATAIAEFASVADALAVLDSLRQSPLLPVACEFTGPTPALWLRFGDDPGAVDWQIAHLPPAAWKVFEGDAERDQWKILAERYREMGPIVARVVGTPSSIGEMLTSFRPASWIAHAANGIVLMPLANPNDLRRIRARFPVIVERAPREIRGSGKTPAFGVTGAELRLMREMKRALDPEGRLNPGRHVDGE